MNKWKPSAYLRAAERIFIEYETIGTNALPPMHILCLILNGIFRSSSQICRWLPGMPVVGRGTSVEVAVCSKLYSDQKPH